MAKKTDAAAKKGALTEKEDPKKDLAKQQKNLTRLEANLEGAHAYGNRVAAWAIEYDLHNTRKLIEKDRGLLAEQAE
jgi:hypothetical protein